MSADHQKLEAVFDAALELSPAEREIYLARACADDPELRQQVEKLLRAFDRSGNFLTQQDSQPSSKDCRRSEATPAAAAPDRTVDLGHGEGLAPEKPGTQIGRYKLREKIGEGGCGVVFVAEQEEPVRRRVALKVIKLGMDTRSVVARFEGERQALAIMDHPNIAKVLDAGATDTGRPYFVMELVRGIRITDYCDQNQLHPGERLDLFIKVCQAVQHAHQKGIIHRDLKPSNILVTLHDGMPVPKVIDFGIAKVTEGRLTDLTIYTELQQFIGTPAYMSPEQAEMSGLDIDTRSDIYSLGVLLYELLTGKTPFDAKELMAAGLDEMRRTIREKEPARPSTRLHAMLQEELTTTARQRHSDAPKLINLLRGDLDWIVMRCLEKDRTRRYETANGLAADIKRHLNNEAVVACPPSATYRFQKLVRRNKLAFVSAGAVLLTLIFALGISTWQAARAVRAQKQATAHEQEARQAQANEQAQRHRAEKAAVEALENLIQQYVDSGNRLVDQGDLYAALPWYIKALEQEKDPVAARRHRYRIGSILYVAPKLVQCWQHQAAVNDITFSPDGRLVASASSDNTVEIRDTVSRRLMTPSLRHASPALKVRFSPDSRLVLTVAGSVGWRVNDWHGGGFGEVKVWEATTGRLIAEVPHKEFVTDAVFTHDGAGFLTTCDDGAARLFDTGTGKTQRVLPHFTGVLSVALSPNDKLAVTSAQDFRLRLWNLETGEVLYTNETSGFPRMAVFRSDGRSYGGIADESGAALYDVASGGVVRTFFESNISRAAAFQLSPEGDRLLMATIDQHVGVWDVATGVRLSAPNYQAKTIGGSLGAAFSPDGRMVLTWTEESARVWSAQTGMQVQPQLRHADTVTAAAFAPESRRIATASADGIVKLWDLASEASLAPRNLYVQWGASTGSWSPDGQRVITSGYTGTAAVWDSFTSEQIGANLRFEPNDAYGLTAAHWSRDGKRLLTADGRGAFQVWDAVTLRPLSPLVQAETNQPICADISLDAERIAVGTTAGQVRLYDAVTGRLVLSVEAGKERIAGIRFGNSGHHLFTFSEKGEIQILDSTSCTPFLPPLHQGAGVTGICASSDDKRLATAGEDGLVRIWETSSGRELFSPLRHRSTACSAEFSPDDRQLLTSSTDGTARLWDAGSGEPIRVLQHDVSVGQASFNRDGTMVATVSGRGARLWDMQTGEPLSPWLNAGENTTANSFIIPTGGKVSFSPSDDRLLVCGFSMPSCIWNVRPTALRLDALRCQARVLAGEASAEYKKHLAADWAEMEATLPGEISISLEQALQWHRSVAEICYNRADGYGLARHMAVWTGAHPDDWSARRMVALGLLCQGRQREALAMDREVLPRRPGSAGKEQLDLTVFYNGRLEDGHSTYGDNRFSNFPSSPQTLDGVQFDARGAINLGGMAALFRSHAYPTNVPAIPVHGCFSRMHVLQAADFDVTEGTLIGRYVLHYLDNQTCELPIRFGVDSSNFWLGRRDKASEASVVWRGSNPTAKTFGSPVGLWKSTYKNPRPGVEVATIDFESTMQTASPFLVAITVQ